MQRGRKNGRHEPHSEVGGRSGFDTSASLLERLRSPDQGLAWERFVSLYTPLLYHWACRTGCREAEAADLVQEVLTLLVRKLPEFRYDRNRTFRGWLRVVAENCWRNLHRRGAVPVAAHQNSRDFFALTLLEWCVNRFRRADFGCPKDAARTAMSAALGDFTIEGSLDGEPVA